MQHDRFDFFEAVPIRGWNKQRRYVLALPVATDALLLSQECLELHQDDLAEKESTHNPQVVMAWFKMYTPTVAAAAVGQLRLSLRLVSPAVDAPRQSEVGSDHALARVSAPPPPPPPPPPIAPSADTEPFAHTSVQPVGPAKAHKATSSRAVKPELDISRFQIVTQKRTYVLAAETSKSARFWLEHLRAVLAVLRHGR